LRVKRKVISAVIAAVALGGLLSGCTSDAQRVSDTLSQDADQFKVQRRIIFYNSITDKYIMTVEGLCSIEPSSTKLQVICEVGPGKYVKDYLGLSDNVTYFVQQAENDATGASKYHHKVVLKPENIIPDFDVELGNG